MSVLLRSSLYTAVYRLLGNMQLLRPLSLRPLTIFSQSHKRTGNSFTVYTTCPVLWNFFCILLFYHLWLGISAFSLENRQKPARLIGESAFLTDLCVLFICLLFNFDVIFWRQESIFPRDLLPQNIVPDPDIRHIDIPMSATIRSRSVSAYSESPAI